MSPRFLCLGVAAAVAILSTSATAQTFGPDFASDYTFVDLGGPAGIPSPLGGLTFKAGDNDTLLIGGDANNSNGAIYEIGVTRDAQGHVNGFSGTATLFATAPNIDGGLVYGPGGLLYFVTYSNNMMGQLKPGSTTPDKMIDLSTAGICSSTGAMFFVPAGFAGAGSLKIVSFNCNTWYQADLVPDGSGTYDVANVTQTSSVTGGGEGMVYIDASNPGFGVDSVLVAEWSAGQVGAYQIDANGDPMLATRRDFLSSLSGAEGAVIDPLTGDFLFSTFGGGDRVLVVSGFTAPTVYCSGKTGSTGCVPTIEFAGSPTLTGADDFSVTTRQTPNNVLGALVWGLSPATTPFGGGTLCVGSPVLGSFGVLSSGGSPGKATDCSGAVGFDVHQAFFSGQGLTAGTSVYMQFLVRDPGFAPPDSVVLSDALTYVLQP